MASELEVFVLVAESGGFANAARRLRLTPSAISRRVAQLEDRLGVQLLARTTRKVELTDAGEAYFRRIKPLLAEIAAATRNLEQFAPVPAGHLRISAPAAFIERHLAELVCEYLVQNAQMRIEMFPSELASNEEYDFAIQSLPSTAQGKASIRLTANSWIVCAAPAYLEKRGTPRHPRDLQGHDCLVINTHPHWRFVVDGNEMNLLAPARFSSFGGAVHRAAIAGHGVARLAAFLVSDDIKRGRLVKLLGEFADSEERFLHLVTDNDKLALPKFATFANFLKAKLAPGF
jgi:DNA-binding transcriptional LysR family regulator